MTREEAISIMNVIVHMLEPQYDTERIEDAVEIAIKALEQENVLDKIRAEMLNDWQIKKFPSSPFSCGLRYAVEIIDKYRGES